MINANSRKGKEEKNYITVLMPVNAMSIGNIVFA